MTAAPTRRWSCRAAFTLLEMMVVMLVLTLLLGAIVAMIRSTVQLTDDVSTAQARESRLHGLAQLCERTFRALPARSLLRLRLTPAASGSRYLSELVLTAAPPVLNGQGGRDDVMVLQTTEAPDGYLRLLMRCMTQEQALAWDRGESQAGDDEQMLLLEDIASLQWKFYHASRKQWQPLWNEDVPLPEMEAEDGARHARPLLVELSLAQGADVPLRWTFWVTAAEEPESLETEAPP